MTLTHYKLNMIREVEARAKLYHTQAAIAIDHRNHTLANIYYRKARIQYRRLKGLLTNKKHDRS